MGNYIVRKLGKNDTQEFRFIAKIHESMPAAWIDNYTVDSEEIEKTERRFVERHKTTSDIICLVAIENSEIIAFIWAEINERDNEVIDIFSLWTNEKYRQQGIATKLKIELEGWAKTKTNAKKIRTTVSAKNKNMIFLNQELGYEIKSYEMIKII